MPVIALSCWRTCGSSWATRRKAVQDSTVIVRLLGGWRVEKKDRGNAFGVCEPQEVHAEARHPQHQAGEEPGLRPRAGVVKVPPLVLHLNVGLQPERGLVRQRGEPQQQLGVAAAAMAERVVV